MNKYYDGVYLFAMKEYLLYKDKVEKGWLILCFCVILMCAFFGFQLKVLNSHKFVTDLDFL